MMDFLSALGLLLVVGSIVVCVSAWSEEYRKRSKGGRIILITWLQLILTVIGFAGMGIYFYNQPRSTSFTVTCPDNTSYIIPLR